MWLRVKRTIKGLPKWQLGILGIFFGIIFLTIFGPANPYCDLTVRASIPRPWGKETLG